MKRRHCLIDRRLQTAEALFILLQPAELNTLYLSPQLSVRPVEVTVMTRSRGSWEGEGNWRRRGIGGGGELGGQQEGSREGEKQQSWVGGGWYERIAVTVRLRLSCYQVFLGVV